MEGKETTQPMNEFYLEIAHWPLAYCNDIGGVRLRARRLGPMRNEVERVLGPFVSGPAVLGIKTLTDLF